MNDFDVLMAKNALSLDTGDELVRFADEFLQAGNYTSAADELASLVRPTAADARPPFRRLLNELSLQIPSREEALLLLVGPNIKAIASGAVEPESGLTALVETICRLTSAPPDRATMRDFGVERLYLLLEQYNYVASSRWPTPEPAEIDAKAIDEARRWLEALSERGHR